MPESFSRRSWYWLGPIVIVGLALRVIGLDQGIPFALGVDEPEIMERAVRMMKTGELHPHFFDYPGLSMYLHAMVATARFLVGAIGGEWAHLDRAPVAEFYLWSRFVTAMLGTLTILMVYWAGRRISPATGLVSAALFAVQSLHVRESHFVLTDVPMTFFVALTWVLTLRAHADGRLRSFIWIGVAAGAAAATKYNGGVALLLPVLALLLGQGGLGWRLWRLAATLLAAGATFLVCAPYTVLALPEFLNAFAYLAHMYAKGEPLAEPVWIIYLKHLRNNMSIPAMLMVLAGMLVAVSALVRRPREQATLAWTLATAFALVYYWMISGQRLVWGRYLLPLLPFACVLAGGTIVAVVDALRSRKVTSALATSIGAVMLIVAAWQPTTNAVDWLSMVAKTSTAKQAYDWITTNIPPNSKIAFESREVLLPADRYRSEFFTLLTRRTNDFYRTEGFDYLVASSAKFRIAFEDEPPNMEARTGYLELFRRNQMVTRFIPSDNHPGSELRIYRVVRDGTEPR
jgi:4-amino-4-deoxy-L-arabinose transferase-like glycosyltransferase